METFVVLFQRSVYKKIIGEQETDKILSDLPILKNPLRLKDKGKVSYSYQIVSGV
jgi:hypothetical protein